MLHSILLIFATSMINRSNRQNKTEITRNWLQERLTVYPPQSADQNPVNLSKIIFSALNFFMHIFNISVTYLSCIKRIHWKLYEKLISQSKHC